MARTKEYDRDTVLHKTVDLFWRQGYKASSVMDIVHATGLNTASMYKEFGDKDGLFEQVLEYYRVNVIGPRVQILTNESNIKGVEAFLDSVFKGAASAEYKGCLMMNHLAQKHSLSKTAAKIIGDFCAEMEGLLETALENAKAAGEIPSDKDPAVMASYIMCSVHGLVLYGRHPEKKKDIGKLHGIILNAIKT